MGRWSQRRMRGTVARDSRVTILFVTLVDGTHLLITWSRAVVVVAGATADHGFDVGGTFPTAVAATSSTTTTLTFADAGEQGDPWHLTAQPGWLTTTTVVPQSGFTL